MSEFGAPLFCNSPSKLSLVSNDTALEYTVSPFCFDIEESNFNNDIDASVMSGFGSLERIANGDWPFGGIKK